MIKTVDALVEALGGTTAVAEMLGIGPSAVSNARAEKKLRESWKYRLSQECEARGIEVDRKLFERPRRKRAA
jgi:hypothetical protein